MTLQMNLARPPSSTVEFFKNDSSAIGCLKSLSALDGLLPARELRSFGCGLGFSSAGTLTMHETVSIVSLDFVSARQV